MKTTDSMTSLTSVDDPRVVQAMEEYLAALETGINPDRRGFLQRHADIATLLADCLDSLEFVHRSAGPIHGTPEGPAPREQAPGTPLGDFRILRELGRGGMGIVYEAEQLSLQRRVALKVLPLAATLDPKQLQRFRHEAQAAAALHHANIVPVFAVGCDRGVHYYAMQFIEGQSLAQVIADLRSQIADLQTESLPGQDERVAPIQSGSPLPQPQSALFNLQSSINNLQSPSAPTQALAALSTELSTKSRGFFRAVANLGMQAAHALKHAHDLGIVHRDIKPANLLVDLRGNLWVTDFGLAHCQSQPGMTMTGDLVGTLRYMSPEQALAQPSGVDQRTDIYALGSTLYELLTLEPAFNGRDRQELLRQIGFEEPRPVRRVNKNVPAEMETIVLKAMAKNPAERYATAGEFADDLERFLKDEPIHARRPTLPQRARKWARRHRPVVWSATAALFVTLTVLAASVGWIVRDRAERQARIGGDLRSALDEGQRALMEGKWPQAQAAGIRARNMLEDVAAEPVLMERVHGLLRDLAAEEADRHLLVQLEAIRLRQTAINLKGDRFALEDSLPDYRQAFGEHGFQVQTQAPELAAAMLRRRSPALRDVLLAALDHWLILARQKETPEALWLEEVLAAADPDPWRQKLRAARELRAPQARQALEQLAREVDVARQRPEALFALELSLRQRGAQEAAVSVLRRAQDAFPGDFWINQDLGLALQDCRPSQLDEAIRFLTAAVAIRPDSPGARLNLGDALRDKGRIDDAIVAYRRAVELSPEYAEAHCNLGRALQQQGEFAQALASLVRGHELGSRRTNWPFPSADWVKACQRQAGPDRKQSP